MLQHDLPGNQVLFLRLRDGDGWWPERGSGWTSGYVLNLFITCHVILHGMIYFDIISSFIVSNNDDAESVSSFSPEIVAEPKRWAVHQIHRSTSIQHPNSTSNILVPQRALLGRHSSILPQTGEVEDSGRCLVTSRSPLNFNASEGRSLISFHGEFLEVEAHQRNCSLPRSTGGLARDLAGDGDEGGRRFGSPLAFTHLVKLKVPV